MVHPGTLLVTTKEKGQRRSKQKKETETSESSDTLRREEQGSEIEHSVLASAHTGQSESFSITLTFPKTTLKATVRAGGLIRAKKGDWRGTEIQMAQSFSDCTAAIHATKVHKGIILSSGAQM